MSDHDEALSVQREPHRLAGWAREYAMLLVLIALGVFFTLATWREQQPSGSAAARQLTGRIAAAAEGRTRVAIVVRPTAADEQFADRLAADLPGAGLSVVAHVAGTPEQARSKLAELLAAGTTFDFIATTPATYEWGIYDALSKDHPQLRDATLIRPATERGSSFLSTDNLLNIANQIAVIAIVAVGMTLVVITGGIDLSVGSLIALSAVTATITIRDGAGATAASNLGLVLCSVAGIAVCAAAGGFSGLVVTRLGVPAFIATLAMMLVASGIAYLASDGQSIDQVPERFIGLGRGTSLLGIPNAVLLMLVLYALAHVLMTRMAIGRAIYAVGGNREAARLAGVPVERVIVLVYILSGALAGLGGIVMASQLKSGAPTYGQMYELYVIAAVVVGGTSLAGGEGRIFGTLTGAFIIAVIQNGMNLTGIESYTQKIVLGSVILAAVALDRRK